MLPLASSFFSSLNMFVAAYMLCLIVLFSPSSVSSLNLGVFSIFESIGLLGSYSFYGALI